MPIALDFGGTPAALGEVQSSLEDFTASAQAEFAAEHDHHGRHATLHALDVDGAGEVRGAMTFADDLLLTGEYGLTLTANTHNLAQSDGRPITAAIIRVQGDAARDLTGLVPPTSANHLRIMENGGTFTITLKHNSGSSTAAYRFNAPSGVDYALLSGQIVLLKYDPHSEIWRILTPGLSTVIQSIQSGSITVTPGNGSNTATITAVNTNKAFVILRGAGVDTSIFMVGASVALTNATTVTATRPGTTDTVTAHFTVVEYV